MRKQTIFGCSVNSLLAVILLVFGASASGAEKRVQQPVQARALAVLETQIKEIPSKRIPGYVRMYGRCIAVFPDVVKAGVIVAAQRGQGLLTCRNRDTNRWGAPAYYNFTAGSIGIQVGIQSATIVLVATNKLGVDAMLREEIGLSGNISVAAGPVGGTVNPDTLTSIASYVRTQGLFAGVDLEGSNLTFATKTNAETYGASAHPHEILFGNVEVPENLQAFHQTLVKWAPAPGERILSEDE